MKTPDSMYIHGEWVEARNGHHIPIIDPASEETVGQVPQADSPDLDKALESAREGFSTWRQADGWTRSRLLYRVGECIRKHADEMAGTLTEEMGKPLPEARSEVLASADQFEWYAGEAPRVYGRLIDGQNRAHRYMVMRQPVGPVAAFSPWNFPSLLTARKMAPAMAAGCSIVVKPPIEAPRSALWLAWACHEAGVPPGVVNMVTGQAHFISEHLIGSDIIRKVSLTGSVPVGRTIMALCARGLKPLSLELGGHSPVLVFEDADIEAAAEVNARGKYRNNGQVCIAASRFFVQESVAQRYVNRFVEVTRSLRIGDGRTPGVDVGPLANEKRRQATQQLVEDAVAKGAVVAAGGRRPPEFRRGFFFEPTVLTGVDPSMQIMQEEPFCPVAPITTFSSLEDGLNQANATSFGLAAYVFTRNTKTAFLAAEGLDVGMVGINNQVIATAEAPFGGVKQSGFGREGGTEWVDAYTTAKYVNVLL